MDNGFYTEFESAFRGPREEIRIRLRAYLPLLRALRDVASRAHALDLGCGRGEFLELLRDEGYAVRGVDLDPGMLVDCGALGLDVEEKSALGELESTQSESALLISAFHLVEHIAFDDLLRMIDLAFDALLPGGVLILETPNPENIEVATVTFHNDPTHRAPVPPNVLRFVAERAGFCPVSLLRLNEAPHVSGRSSRLRDVFEAVSPDYAVVAQKPGPADLMDAAAPFFAAERGLRLEHLADRFEARLAMRDELLSLSMEVQRVSAHAVRINADLRAEHERLVERMRKVERSAKSFDKTLGQRLKRAWYKIRPRKAAEPKAPIATEPPPRSPGDAKPITGMPPQGSRPAQEALPERLRWRIEGPLETSYSLSVVNRELARALARAGVDVALLAADGPGPLEVGAGFAEAEPDLAPLLERAALPADIVTRNMFPPRSDDWPSNGDGPMRGLAGFAWEETGIAPDWVAALNARLRFATVTSTHAKKTLIDNGAAFPIANVGNGVDHLSRAPYEDLPAGLVPNAGRIFLHVSSLFPRKGGDVLLTAWGRAFTREDNVALVIKTFDNPHNEAAALLARLAEESPDHAPVSVVQTELRPGQMRSLYRAADRLVLPTRAEGFCLPIAEALLEGTPVITTGWSGTMEYHGCPLVDFLDYRLVPAESHHGLVASLWAEPDLDALVQRFRTAQTESAPMPETVDAARAWLLERFTWDAVAARSVEAVRKAAVTRFEPPRIGWVSTFNTRCGIATYSAHLLRELGQDVHVLAPFGTETVVPDAAHEMPITRCWSDDARDPLLRLAARIRDLDLDTIVLQFNYAFFDFESLARLIAGLKKEGRRVVLMMHGTNDAKAPPDRQVAEIAPALETCDRLLVHSLSDLARLKAIGLSENVTLFPHGTLPPRLGDPPARDGPVTLATYGFLLPNKGLPEIIEAVHRLRERGVEVNLRMYNADYPQAVSQRTRLRCMRAILSCGLSPNVVFDTRFRDDADVLADLERADLVVFPYQASAESASGAVRFGLASGRPVVTTPLAIFEDVAGTCLSLPGVSPAEIAEGLEVVVRQVLAGETFDTVRSDARAFCDRVAYPRLAPQLGNLLYGLKLNG